MHWWHMGSSWRALLGVNQCMVKLALGTLQKPPTSSNPSPRLRVLPDSPVLLPCTASSGSTYTSGYLTGVLAYGDRAALLQQRGLQIVVRPVLFPGPSFTRAVPWILARPPRLQSHTILLYQIGGDRIWSDHDSIKLAMEGAGVIHLYPQVCFTGHASVSNPANAHSHCRCFWR